MEGAMPAKIIDVGGLLAEVEETDRGAQFTAGDLGEKLEPGLIQIKPILRKICAPVIDAWKDLSASVTVKEAELEIGFSFEGEGNLYITKAKAGANLVVKIKFEALCAPKDGNNERCNYPVDQPHK